MLLFVVLCAPVCDLIWPHNAPFIDLLPLQFYLEIADCVSRSSIHAVALLSLSSDGC